MNIKLDEDGIVRCPSCNAMMRKLYWVYRDKRVIENVRFTYWYGCTDCGEFIYDKHRDVVLSHSSGEKASDSQ